MEENKNSKELVKTVGLATATFTVVGSIIGAGVFFKPQAIYTATGGAPGIAMLCWLIAGLVTICAGLTVSELATSIPKTGGMAIYIKEMYGDMFGFLAGWVQVFLYFPAMIAALAVVFADQFVALSGMPSMKMPITVLMLIIVFFFHLQGGKQSAAIGNISTVSKVLVLFIIIIAGFILGKNNASITQPFIGEGVNPVVAGGQVLLALFFVFDGWINVCALAGEMKNPAKDLSKAIVGGILIVLAIYVIVNIAYLRVLPAKTLGGSASPGLDVAKAIFGDIGGLIIGAGIMISVFGCASAFSFTGSRVLYAIAQDDVLPKSDKLSKLNKNGVPGNSIIVIGIISFIYAMSGQFNLLSDFAIFSIWIFIVLTFFAVFKNRKLKDPKTFAFRVPAYPLVPILAILGGAFVLGVQLITSTLLSLGSIIILLLGVPIYKWGSKKVKNNNI
ncbi:APC family permease [Peptostreptococcus equinus]|uniref:Amino acid permease n=1 Tax=Peptostreptococcus equinus TaxID=3003601 RepID=A0ABY7JS90_9FIRM|nr:amino acid permease [Peptostreptococcus sp. CBA3647]WAW14850.1 amino acid permease [Peptostreptococcus sp. CBA3647]